MSHRLGVNHGKSPHFQVPKPLTSNVQFLVQVHKICQLTSNEGSQGRVWRDGRLRRKVGPVVVQEGSSHCAFCATVQPGNSCVFCLRQLYCCDLLCLDSRFLLYGINVIPKSSLFNISCKIEKLDFQRVLVWRSIPALISVNTYLREHRFWHSLSLQRLQVWIAWPNHCKIWFLIVFK